MTDLKTPAPILTSGNAPLLSKLSGLRFGNHIGLIVVLAAVLVVTSIGSEAFLTANNIINVLRQVSVIAVIAAGLTLIMTAGDIDFSMASNTAVTTAVLAQLISSGVPAGTAIGIAIAIATAIGLVNGLVVVLTGAASFVVTLATATLLDGLALLVIDGMSVSSGDSLSAYGSGELLGIPYLLITAGFVCIAVGVTMKFTVFGRNAFAIGGNPDVARLSGIAVSRNKLFLFSLNGLLAGLAGVMLLSRLGAASPGNAGLSLELTAVAAVVIGGTALAGGRGTIVGTALGVILLGVVANALNLLGVSSYYQAMSVGAVLLIAAVANQLRKRSAR